LIIGTTAQDFMYNIQQITHDPVQKTCTYQQFAISQVEKKKRRWV